MKTVIYALFGYLSGSVLYANVFSKLFHKKNELEQSKDKNPGTANAFMYGGMLCGIFTLICELLKGIIPVHLYLCETSYTREHPYALAIILLAPVLGHIYPLFHEFRGGKGIAVTFGCLLGMVPEWTPVLIFAGFFIFYSLILRITPHFYRTIVTYISTQIILFLRYPDMVVNIGFLCISIVVLYRMHQSTEIREKLQVKLLWRH